MRFYNSAFTLRSSYRNYLTPDDENYDGVGFRVSSLGAVPEPATYAALISAAMLGAVFLLRRRHAAGAAR